MTDTTSLYARHRWLLCCIWCTEEGTLKACLLLSSRQDYLLDSVVT